VGSDLAGVSCFLWSYLTVCFVVWSVCLVRVEEVVFGGLYLVLHYLYKG
jgi:hypothetical protein